MSGSPVGVEDSEVSAAVKKRAVFDPARKADHTTAARVQSMVRARVLPEAVVMCSPIELHLYS